MNHENHKKTRKKKVITEGTKKHKMGFDVLVGLFEQTQTAMQVQAAQSVDIALVVRNWLFGWYIVEFESCGAERAELYGKKLLEKLAASLKQSGLKGVSLTNLKLCRTFYKNFQKIGQTVSDQSHLYISNMKALKKQLEEAQA